MDLITQALNKVFRRIPKEVLDICYGSKADIPSSIASNIEDKVFRSEVFNDINLMSCNQIIVSLQDLTNKGQYGDKVIYDVPASITNNLPIISITAVVGGLSFGKGGATSVRTSILNQHSITIDVYDDMYIFDGKVEMMLAYDDRLKEIDPIFYPEIIKAMILAVKADIYNELVITLDSGALYYGRSIDGIKSKVDEYADAAELYDEQMDTVVGKTLFRNSDELMTDWVTAMMPNEN